MSALPQEWGGCLQASRHKFKAITEMGGQRQLPLPIRIHVFQLPGCLGGSPRFLTHTLQWGGIDYLTALRHIWFRAFAVQ